MKIFLTGATGFVGSHLLRRLLRDGYEVQALVRRRGALAGAGSGVLKEVEGDILSQNLAQSMTGCDAAINLVGIIYEQGRQTFEAIHHQGTRNLVKAARQAGVSRFVQMSALGARPQNATEYHTSKFAAEEEVRNSGLSWVVLRPSLIFGRGSAFVQQMIKVMRVAPLIRPVPGTGEYRFRPVHVEDVAECFAQSLTNPQAVGRTIDLVGGEELTLNEITDEIASCMNIRKTVVHLPMSLMKMAAAVFSLLPVDPPVTSVQLRMLKEGSAADPGPMKQVFGIDPTAFGARLRRDLTADHVL
ncbi:MAG TPA: complex I NDUFA9 subunit family protein [Terriglobales bacterium]|nr:complex I NDUFA9 subunit family protein [Terriglobales bacterium]